MKPRRLFKYQGFTQYSIDSIRRQHFCFSNRKMLNDENELNFEFHIPNEEDAKKRWLEISLEEGTSESDLFFVELGLSVDVARIHYFKQAIEELTVGIQEDLNKVGILSLTEKEDDEYMWKEYGGDSTGYCLQIYPDYQHHLFREELFKVTYSDDVLRVSMLAQDHREYHRVLLNKNLIWSKENEWRIVLPRNLEGPFELVELKGIIEKIILGSRISSEHEEKIRSAAPRNIDVVKKI
jgi:hypothetical protein